jgi:hypothetical protein
MDAVGDVMVQVKAASASPTLPAAGVKPFERLMRPGLRSCDAERPRLDVSLTMFLEQRMQ